MYRRIKDFIADWKEQDGMSVRVLDAIPDEAKSKKVHEHVRELDALWWHIIQVIDSIGQQTGILHKEIDFAAPVPATMSEIKAAYLQSSKDLIEAIQQNWTEEDLNKEFTVFGRKFNGSTILSILVGHTTHHRSQMTVTMRLLGLRVPGLFGPAREDWEAMGMEAKA